MEHEHSKNQQPPPPLAGGSHYNYGYPAVPNFYYTSPDPPPSMTKTCTKFFCRFCFILTLVFLLLIAGSIFFLFLSPMYPYFRLTSATVSLLNLSPSSNPNLTATFNVSLSIWTAKDQMEVDYDTFAGSVVYGDIEEVVATTQLSLPAVNDKEKFRDTPVQIKVVVVFEQPEVAEMISRDVARDGAVQFDLRFAMTCIEENSWWSSKSELQVWTFCENVMMVFRNATMASIGSMMGPARYCTVYAD